MDQEKELTSEEINQAARVMALQFEEVADGKKWFKPIHIQRNTVGQSEHFIKKKLDILVELDFAKAKSIRGGDMKYCITVSDEQRLDYLKEYLIHLEDQVSSTKSLCEVLSKKIIASE
jgi:threonine synthase